MIAGVHYLQEQRLRVVRKLFRILVYGRSRMYLTRMDLLFLANLPVEKIDGFEFRCVRPDDTLLASFPHLGRSTISQWARPGYFFFLGLLDGRPVGYRCWAITAAPSLRQFLRLRPHQLFTIDIFTHPDFRRRGLVRPIKIMAARHLVPQGYREVWSVERPTNYDTVIAADRTGTVRVGTLIRTSCLGLARFTMTPVTVLSPTLVGHQLDLLKRQAPSVTRAAVLFNPSLTRSSPTTADSIRALAAARGVDLAFVEVREVDDQAAALERAFTSMTQTGVQGVILHSDPMLRLHARTVVTLARSRGLAAVFDAKPFAAAGGLVARGATSLRLSDFDAVMAYFDAQQRATP